MTARIFEFETLKNADLVIDATYKGGIYGDVRDDPIAPLLGGGNQGGFRYEGSPRDLQISHCILYSSLGDVDWPDELDLQTGRFTYYGDNKTPGNDLHG